MMPAAPKLRFPEFKDPWKPGHAGDAFKNSRAKGAAGLPIYSVTMDRGLVRRDSMDRHMAADAADGQNLRAQRGDVVYNMMRMWQGAVGLAPEECMVSPAYVVLSPKKHTSPQFFDQWFKAKRMLYLLGAYSHGITSDRLRLYADDFARIPLHLPTLPEQQKIAAFLRMVDAKLVQLTAKQAALVRFKAGLMQKLFSQKLRFAREDGTSFPDWEEKELRVVSIINPKSPNLPERFHYIDLESVNAGTLGAVSEIVATEAPSRAQRVLQRGDILFQTVRPYQRNNLYFDLAGVYVGSTGYAQIRAKQNRHYLFQVLHTDQFVNRVLERCTGTGYPAINSNDLGKVTIPLPHADEQQKIADALSTMDTKVQAVADQVAKLQTFKKGLLQQMFV